IFRLTGRRLSRARTHERLAATSTTSTASSPRTFECSRRRSIPVARWSVSVSPTCPEAWADSDVRTSRCRTCRSPTTIGSVSGTTPGSSPPAVPCRDYGRDYADCGLGVQRRGDQHGYRATIGGLADEGQDRKSTV